MRNVKEYDQLEINCDNRVFTDHKGWIQKQNRKKIKLFWFSRLRFCTPIPLSLWLHLPLWIFSFHSVKCAPMTPTSSLMKTSLDKYWREGYTEKIISFIPYFRNKPWARIRRAFAIKFTQGQTQWNLSSYKHIS